MKKLLIFIISILFFVNRDNIIISGINAINIWSKTLFPILFPTLIINDLLLSTDIIKYINRYFGLIYCNLFKCNSVGSYTLFMSFISGTPSNVKNLKQLYDNNIIDKDDITKILCSCYFYNPLYIISVLNVKVLISIYIANMVASVLLNFRVKVKRNDIICFNKEFSLVNSIDNNIHIMLNILGTITIFLCLSSIIPINNIYLKILISGILEISTGINLINSISNNLIIYKIILSIILGFGGISLLYQIKSILKDTSLNYKYFFLHRIICTIIIFMLTA